MDHQEVRGPVPEAQDKAEPQDDPGEGHFHGVCPRGRRVGPQAGHGLRQSGGDFGARAHLDKAQNGNEEEAEPDEEELDDFGEDGSQCRYATLWCYK